MIKRIKFEKLKNTRDLGGFVCSDGRKIKSRLLLRSGELGKATKNDINLLRNGYDLRTVIDLRTDAEKHQSPDPAIDGVEYIECPLLDNSFLGIARDEYSIEAWLNLFVDSDRQPVEIFGDMYLRLTFDEYVRPYVKKIFDILANADGAVLWHCSAGKDRVGVTTALILSVLGVPEEVIVRDYLMTGVFTFPEIAEIRFLAGLKYHNKKMNEAVACLMGVRKEYIVPVLEKAKAEYGSVEGMLVELFGIAPETLEAIRKKYLE